ncbi:MAG: homoserine dehydrogenase [Rhodospirillales bacterium]|nr:homoserine dehydrogenase [Alphaproteobacteria bacterium]MCB9987258.1 homoserine dehydrogenase [Rhodospirillales bacterium]USO07882.1 MAG: homoserine dehydrogenase [Rhodospirillales bacterium]
MNRAPLRIGLAGLGTVGAAVAREILLHGNALAAQAGRPVVLSAACARDRSRDRGIDLSGVAWVDAPVDLAAREDVDAVVELMGGAEGAALALARATLGAGKPLVTANKAMLAAHWGELFDAAVRANLPLKFEASVCGGIPVIKVLREGLSGNRITAIEGILNGTCNYILSTMERTGRAFADVLAEAQAKGYAEADPTLDVDGWDAAHKLTILAKLAFDAGVTTDMISVSGIRTADAAAFEKARAAGRTLRLVGRAARIDAGLELSVSMMELPLDHPLAAIAGAMNAVTIMAEPVGVCTLIGPGAGAGPTASAVLADIVDLARQI